MSQRTMRIQMFAVTIVLALLPRQWAVAADAPRGGVGISIMATLDGHIFVQAVLAGGPADWAGVKTGDVILSVNGRTLSGLSPAEVAVLIAGPPDTEVQLRVRHALGQEATLAVRRTALHAAIGSTSQPSPQMEAREAPLPANATHNDPPRHPAAAFVRMHKVGIRDAQAGQDAYEVLVPEDWQAGGGVVWHPDRAAAPADVTVRVRNPNGSEEFTLFPGQLFTWSPLVAQTVPPGQKYLGCEVRRPMDGALTALKMIVVPRFRPEVSNKCQLVTQTDLPQLAQAAAPMYQQPGVPVIVRAGRIRIEYALGDHQMQEDLTCVFFNAQSPAGATWALDQITSFRAEKGKLDKQMPLLETIAFSARPNLAWFDQYTAVSQTLVQGFYQTQAQIMERARIQRDASQHVSETIRQAYETRQAAMDRIAQTYDEKAVRGVQAYHNPLDGSTVEVPDEYEHVWTNPAGEYIYSNNPRYDPNVGSNLHWQELEKAN